MLSASTSSTSHGVCTAYSRLHFPRHKISVSVRDGDSGGIAFGVNTAALALNLEFIWRQRHLLHTITYILIIYF